VEEGPEPHEFIKESVEHHHHAEEEGHGPDHAKRETIISACTAAVLAVCAAIGSLLSGHAANEAILHQSKATDQWSYYQAKSTKGHIYQVGKDIIGVLSEAQGAGRNAQRVQQQFEEQVKKYKEDKEEPEREARHLEQESERQFDKHHSYALGVAAFQVGIVMASISIMVRYRPVWYLSLAGGAAGAILLVAGLLK
jgi:Domain of unknown function (DUF4337)